MQTNWVWLTCVATLAAAVTWTGTGLMATGPDQTSQATRAAQRPASPQQSPTQSSQGRAGDPNAARQSFTPFSAFEWWNDADVKKEIGLAEDKAKKIHEYYERRNREMQPWIEDWRRERTLLEKMTQERVADRTTYGIQVWRLEQLSAKLRETRAMMAYQMYLELSPEQYKKLREWQDRRSNGRGGRGGPGPR